MIYAEKGKEQECFIDFVEKAKIFRSLKKIEKVAKENNLTVEEFESVL